MTDLTPESLAELRRAAHYPTSVVVVVPTRTLLALLDAAERLVYVESEKDALIGSALHYKAERDALAAKVELVRAMHRERPYADPEMRAVAPSLPAFVCQHCWGQANVAVPHPCPTIRALDGASIQPRLSEDK